MRYERPRANRNPVVVADKVSRLREPHISALTTFVERLRSGRGGGDAIPWFDPDSAGTNARILVLLEAPGPRAVGHAARPAKPGSGFISIDNDDSTAENSWNMYQEAGLDYAEHALPWNIVPWYVGDGKKIRGVTIADLKEAEPALRELIGLLPRLRVVVLLGRKAQKGWARLRTFDVRVVVAPHPSPLVLNTDRGARAQIVEALRTARDLARLPPDGDTDS